MGKGKELCPQCGAELTKTQVIDGVVPTRSPEKADRLERLDKMEEEFRRKVKKMGDEQRRAWANAPPTRFTI